VITVDADLYEQNDLCATVSLTIVLPVDPQALKPGNVVVIVKDFKADPKLCWRTGVIKITNVVLVRNDTSVPVVILREFAIYNIDKAYIYTHSYPEFDIVYPGTDLDQALRRLTLGKVHAKHTRCDPLFPFVCYDYAIEVFEYRVSTKIMGADGEESTKTITNIATTRTVTTPGTRTLTISHTTTHLTLVPTTVTMTSTYRTVFTTTVTTTVKEFLYVPTATIVVERP